MPSTSVARSTRSNRKADKVLKKAVTRLFADDSQMWNAIRMREFYFLQEHVLDYCQEAARTVEEILIENS